MNGETHKYIFDGWSITAETNKDGELKSREVRGYGLVKKEIDNKQYYYHQNEHGDITHLTNTDSEVENNYQYDVFGNIREQQENVENVFKYAGEQQDQETEQYYLRARFYNPVIARFTQEDVYRGDGLNLYVYVVNNPLLWIDPSGYAKKCSNENKFKKDDNLPPGMRQRLENELGKYRDELNRKINENHPKARTKNKVVDGTRTFAIGLIDDIEPLQGQIFKGASRRILNSAKEKLLDNNDDYKDRTIRAPFENKQHIDHAEEGVMASFEKALKDANIAHQDVSGTFYMIQSNGGGICTKCTAGLPGFPNESDIGIFKQFTELYPNLKIIAITSENAGSADKTNTLTIQLENGEVSCVLRNIEGVKGYFKE